MTMTERTPEKTCPRCAGSGYFVEKSDKCFRCNGTGKVPAAHGEGKNDD